jgi:hypothetical protein
VGGKDEGVNQRARNRIAEHASHGWKETAKTKTVRPELVLMECPAEAPCHGWMGWLPRRLVEKGAPKE